MTKVFAFYYIYCKEATQWSDARIAANFAVLMNSKHKVFNVDDKAFAIISKIETINSKEIWELNCLYILPEHRHTKLVLKLTDKIDDYFKFREARLVTDALLPVSAKLLTKYGFEPFRFKKDYNG